MIYVYIWHWIGGKNCRKSLYLMGNSHGFRLRFSRKPNQWIYGSWSMEVDLKVKYNYINYIYIPEPPIGTQKCVPFFSARFQKMCPFKGLKKKKVSEVPWLSIVINLILSPKARWDKRTLLSRASACAACQIRPRTATPDNMGCIAAHVNNRALDRVNLKYPPQHHVCFSYAKIPPANNLQL